MAAATMILILTLVWQVTSSQQPIAMHTSLEGKNSSFFYALFNSTIFEQFYSCMTQANVTCILNWKFGPTYYNKDDRSVFGVDQLQITPQMDQVHGNDFICTNDQRNSTITCEHSTKMCPDGFDQQSFNLRDTICDKSCVTICWKVKGERLVYHPETHKIDLCNAPCTQPTTASATPAADNSGEQTNSNTSLIAGVICGVLVFVVAVIVVAVVLWRRRQLCITNCKDPSRRLRSSFTSEPVQEAAYNTRLAKINSYESSELDASPNVTDNRNMAKEDSNVTDGYYKLDYNFLRNSNQILTSQSRELTSAQTRNDHRETLDTAVQDDEGDYSCISDSASNNRTAGYSNVVVVPMSMDEYSMAHNVNSLNESEVTDQQQTVYSKLGQNVTVKVNPYNCFSESHDASEDDSSSGQHFSQASSP